LSQQTQKIELMKDYKIKTAQYNANFNNLQNEINSLKNTPTSIGLFYSKKESEELYQSLSIYATNNGLSITSLNKGNPQKVGPGGAQKVGKDGKPAAVQASYYYKIPVTFQVKGSYIGYLKFRAALSRSSKFVNFDKENIVVNQGDRTNTITADVAITIVGLPDEFN
jgi:Tfp pilus assembly protein PilO